MKLSSNLFFLVISLLLLSSCGNKDPLTAAIDAAESKAVGDISHPRPLRVCTLESLADGTYLVCDDGTIQKLSSTIIGTDGTSCSVTTISNGAIITCDDGTSAEIHDGVVTITTPDPQSGSGSGVDTGSGSGIDTGSGSGIDTGSGSGIDTGSGSGIDTGSGDGSNQDDNDGNIDDDNGGDQNGDANHDDDNRCPFNDKIEKLGQCLRQYHHDKACIKKCIKAHQKFHKEKHKHEHHD